MACAKTQNIIQNFNNEAKPDSSLLYKQPDCIWNLQEEKENVRPSDDAPACLITPWSLSLQN